MSTYAIKLLVLQRKVRYPGELAPEVLAVVDEVTLDDNPDWWPAEVQRQRDVIGEDAERWAEVIVHLNRDDIDRALFPINVVRAEVQA